MKNIIDYLAETRDLLFTEKPFCAADSLVLAQIAYINFEGITASLWEIQPVRLTEAIQLLGIRPMCKDTLYPEKNEKLLFALLNSSRYRDLLVCAYINDVDLDSQKQFAAMTFIIPGNPVSIYVAFRGTDATLIGWKEDFNMAYAWPVPAQADAVTYLNRVAGVLPGRIQLGGHSKGGNLAIYAAVKCESAIHQRIEAVFNHDGPGFKEDIYSEDTFADIADRVFTSLPKHSIIGMLLEHDSRYQVVESSSIGLLQHDPFTWGIKDGDLQIASRLNDQSIMFDKTMKSWLNSMSDDDRKRFIDVLFQVAGATDVNSFREVRADWKKAVGDSLNAIKDIDDATRKFVLKIMLLFMKSVSSNIHGDLKQKLDSGRALFNEKRISLRQMMRSGYPRLGDGK